MEFVDYYAALGLPKPVRAKKVQEAFDKFIQRPDPKRFDVCLRAYDTLKNPYKRARYNKTFGYLMIISVTPREYLNAVHYQLHSIQPYKTFQAIIEKFKTWIVKKYDFDWREAQLAHYSYQLHNEEDENPWLLLRFPVSGDLESFSRWLMAQRVIKLF